MSTLEEIMIEAMEYAYVAGDTGTQSLTDHDLRLSHWKDMAEAWSEKLFSNTSNDFTLRELQTNLPWTIRYSTDFRSSPVTHKDFGHALTHIVKAAGMLAALVDDMDHDKAVADDPTRNRSNYGKYIADLVICALRLSNTIPGGVLDLQRAVQHRLETKNGIELRKSA